MSTNKPRLATHSWTGRTTHSNGTKTFVGIEEFFHCLNLTLGEWRVRRSNQSDFLFLDAFGDVFFLNMFFLKCEDHSLIFTVENPCKNPIHIKHDIWYLHQQHYHTWTPCNFECFSSIPSAWGWSSKWRKSFQVLGKPKVFTTSELRIKGLQQKFKIVCSM